MHLDFLTFFGAVTNLDFHFLLRFENSNFITNYTQALRTLKPLSIYDLEENQLHLNTANKPLFSGLVRWDPGNITNPSPARSGAKSVLMYRIMKAIYETNACL